MYNLQGINNNVIRMRIGKNGYEEMETKRQSENTRLLKKMKKDREIKFGAMPESERMLPHSRIYQMYAYEITIFFFKEWR